MNINKELTNKFYESYNPCNCGDCRFFIKNIENNQANIFKYLKSFNINPLKPYELVSIFNEKDRMIEYLDCVYVVFGTIDNAIETTIDGIKITSCNKERYPLLKTNDEYFLITFGPVYMNYSYTLNRHLTLDDKIQIIKKAIDDVDPMKLLAIDCPKDEYINEATIIAKKMKNNELTVKCLKEVFKKQFNESITLKECIAIASKVNIYLYGTDYFKNIEENEIFKDKITINDNEIILKIHDNFIVNYNDYNIYINNKLYSKVKEKEIFDYFYDFLMNDEIIYIQYESLKLKTKCFKMINKSNYSYKKLKGKNIELIFDNKKLIYSKKINKDEIIKIMFNEPTIEQSEKIFYSLDKTQRLVVFKNNAKSYSYYIEKLIILDKYEAYFLKKNAYWEPQYVCTSFYENINDLLKDINALIQGWTEK